MKIPPTNPVEMEPLLPTGAETRDLQGQAIEVLRKSAQLTSALPPKMRLAISELVRSMQSYYSNLIEGHKTRPADIDAALAGQFSSDDKRRVLQHLHLAHLEADKEMAASLKSGSRTFENIADNLQEWHRIFFSKVPEELLYTEDGGGQKHRTVPGELRNWNVTVGEHLAPEWKEVPDFLRRVEDFYAPKIEATPDGLIAVAAAHHRIAWIHPFADGNGRVARLFTQSCLWKAGSDGNGLWSISRGFARQEGDYKSLLARADRKRTHDFDGRGILSDRALGEWCRFFLKTCVDQIEFMGSLIEPEKLLARVKHYGDRLERERGLQRGTSELLGYIVKLGEIQRGEVAKLTGTSERTGRRLISDLLDAGVLQSPSQKGSLSLHWTTEAAELCLPRLFPVGTDDGKEVTTDAEYDHQMPAPAVRSLADQITENSSLLDGGKRGGR